MKIILPAIFLLSKFQLLLAGPTGSKVADNHDKIKQEMKNGHEFDKDILIDSLNLEGESEEGEYDQWDAMSLPEDIRIARFQKIISKMDEDSSNSISRKELVQWTLKALQKMDAREMGEDFELADGDEDGKVSWKEYVVNIYGVEEELIENFTEADVIGNAELADLNRLYNREYAKFVAADYNEDGLLDEKEYELFYNPANEPKSISFAIDHAMKQVDKDGDGTLSLDEYLNDFKVPMQDEEESDNKQSMIDIFMELDLNKNNKLDGDELSLWIQQDNGEIAADEASHLINECDEDENESLSYKEMEDCMEDFLESDATEYGFQLKHDEL